MSPHHEVLAEEMRGSFDGTIPFPEVVARLGAIGVERYVADLVRLEKTYYFASGDTATEAMPLADAPAIGDEFVEHEVQQALRANQQGEILYPEFLYRIVRAGVASYVVFLMGRRAVYIGRHGGLYVERFPDTQ